MNSLRKYASQNIDVNQPKLEEFVSYVDSVGIEVKDGIKKIEVSYHRIKGIGRRYAGKYSMQRHSRAARKAAFEKIGHDIDMVNAGFSILSLLLQEKNLIDKFPMIDSLRKNPFLWRKMTSKYYGESLENSKWKIVEMLGGVLPTGDNPLLWKLMLEIIDATKILVNISDYSEEMTLQLENQESLFSKLFLILSEEEDKLLQLLENKIKNSINDCSISLRMFDGIELYIDKKNWLKVEEVLSEFMNDTGIKVIIKSR